MVLLDTCIHGFCICGFNQLGIENIENKCDGIADMCYVGKSTMVASALNTQRFFFLVIIT